MVGYSKITTREGFEEYFKHVDISDVVNTLNASVWTHSPPPPDRHVAPSQLFLELLGRMDKCWNRNKEATTRTYIDQVILDVLWGRKDILRDRDRRCKGYRPFGEVWSKTDEYAGSSDYMLGYGTDDSELTSMLLTIEAKCYLGDTKPWQLLAIMSHFQLLRMHAQKKIHTIFGILTDSDIYRFFRLDENHKVWRSKPYTMQGDMNIIWEFIDYMIDTAEKMTPTSTPLGSHADLFQDASFSRYIERFQIQSASPAKFDMNALYDGMQLLFTESDGGSDELHNEKSSSTESVISLKGRVCK
jgi:hypothetical protein